MKKCPSPTGFFKVDNLLSEIWTEAQKSIARKNLGIADDSSLFWGNIKGYIENQKDIKSYINNTVKKETKFKIAELLETSENVLDLINNLSNWAESGGDIQSLAMNVSQNTEKIKKLQNRVMYLTQQEYDELIREGLIEDNVEYNIYEEDETI